MSYLHAPFIGAGSDELFSYLEEDNKEENKFNNDKFNIMNNHAFLWLGSMRQFQTTRIAYIKTHSLLENFKKTHAKILNQTGVVIDPKIRNKKLSLEKELFYAKICLSTSKEEIEKIEKKVGKDFIQKELSQYWCRVIKNELLAITLHPDNKDKLLPKITQ